MNCRQILGRFVTFYPGAKADFQVAIRIRDLDTNRVIDYRLLENVSEGDLLGSVRFVNKLPVVIPQYVGAEQSAVERFVVPLDRGHIYRIELFAAARSTSGPLANPGATSLARVDLLDQVPDIGSYMPGVQLVSFSIEVANDQADEVLLLKSAIESLQRSIATLSEQHSDLVEDLNSQIEDLLNTIANLQTDVALLEDQQSQLKDPRKHPYGQTLPAAPERNALNVSTANGVATLRVESGR